MQVYIKDYNHEKFQRILSPLILGWGISCVSVSKFGRFVSGVLFIAIVVFGIITLVKSRSSNSDYTKPRAEVDFESFKRNYKLSLPISLTAGIVSIIVFIIFDKKDFSSYYGIGLFISGIVLSCLFFIIPLIFRAFVKAAENNSTDLPCKEAAYRTVIRWKNLSALVFAFLISYVMLFYVSPFVMKTSQEYVSSLDLPLTHDIYAVSDYKASDLKECNTEELLSKMPYNSKLVSSSCINDKIEIVYKDASLSELEGKRVFVYNSTALFALIDNLREIEFDFNGERVKAYRKDTVEAYDDFEGILNNWFKVVTYPMADEQYSERLYKATANN